MSYCLFCSKELISGNKYCSSNCKSKFYYHNNPESKRKTIERQKEYYRSGRNKIYNKECILCKKGFKTHKNNAKYCSPKCFYVNRRFGWKSKREEALENADSKCEKCGYPTGNDKNGNIKCTNRDCK